MKKRAVLGFFCLIIFYSSSIFGAFNDLLVENTKSAVVALYADEDLTILRGSGFFIDSSGTIITAEHVVRGYSDLWALLYDGRKLKLIPIEFQKDNDLAILLPRISNRKTSSFPYLKLSEIDGLVIGIPVMTIGNSWSGLWQILYGKIYNLYLQVIVDDKKYNFTIVSHIAIQKGFSGSPLISEDGEVLGINIAISVFDRNFSYAITSSKIKEFIGEFYKKSPDKNEAAQ